MTTRDPDMVTIPDRVTVTLLDGDNHQNTYKIRDFRDYTHVLSTFRVIKYGTERWGAETWSHSRGWSALLDYAETSDEAWSRALCVLLDLEVQA